MRSLAFLAALAMLGACASGTSRKAAPADEWSPKFERTKSLYEVLDEKSGERLGFVEKTTYDDGRVVYWVTNADRSIKYGYMLPNNQGYKYDWYLGERSKEARFIGADTHQANARRILDHDLPVTLREVSWEALLKETGGAEGGSGK